MASNPKKPIHHKIILKNFDPGNDLNAEQIYNGKMPGDCKQMLMNFLLELINKTRI